MRQIVFSLFVLTAALTTAPALAAQQATGAASDDADQQGPDRIFGVLPNYATIEQDRIVPPITPKERLRIAALDSFDPYVYPFVGVIAGLNALEKEVPT